MRYARAASSLSTRSPRRLAMTAAHSGNSHVAIAVNHTRHAPIPTGSMVRSTVSPDSSPNPKADQIG